MDFDKLLEFIDKADTHLVDSHGIDDKEKLAYARVTKINEEFGELSAEVLKNFGKQRQNKLEDIRHENLESEFADVIITVLLLAKTMNVDIRKSLAEKIIKIKERLMIS